ncbi:DUF305 domain-containing protein [Actinoplanes bogorensis]|uniref:DUF305 domain-containing protein n=1 Tax=Paractinoplanes bogorensis TaxID=1610840 RepID=A0ABS5YZQ1_9ACTN|nr:DUF305 domain-containing protein [Actinoplanes bogorensis]MBU2668930.1 DUF305 domain-containing protein [Actinoplanes bogorensis]
MIYTGGVLGRVRTSTLVAAAVVLAGAVTVAIAARMGGGDSAAAPRPSASAGPPVRVVLPGAPGDDAVVTDSDQVKAPDGSTYNGVDTAFVQMMIVHHEQAITMAKLAPGRAENDKLAALADRIAAAQPYEINFFRAWLKERGLPETDPGHDHAGMAGMQSEADMSALAAATGSTFDARFAAMMTAHHQGALQMAGDVLKGGNDEKLREVANEMAVEQGSEIRRLQQVTAG